MDQLERLKANYFESLVGQIEALKSSLTEFQEIKSSESFDSIQRIAHKLAGSGGTFGYMEISQKAILIEEATTDSIVDLTHSLIDVLYKVLNAEAGRSARLLIVDDDPLLCSLLGRILDRPNREIVVAHSAKEAQKILTKDKNISLIILDLLLPDMDGRELLSKIREKEHLATVPVIVMTGDGGGSSQAECYAFGASLFFEKPFDTHALAAAVATQLKQYLGHSE